ncbi:MAG: hypothetical protein KF759_01295 [Dokdonella sp.]|nr:hypothetical protein [Dokdonella sp.]
MPILPRTNSTEHWMITTVVLAGLISGVGRLWPMVIDAGLLRAADGIAIALGGWMLVYALARRLFAKQLSRWCDAPGAARDRYMRRLGPAMVLYMITLVGSIVLIKRGIEPVALRAAVAVVPMLPIAMVASAMVRYVRDVDEMQQRIETLAVCIAALLVSLGYFAGGLLVAAKVLELDAGAAMLWVFPLLCVSYGLAKFFVMRRYQ